MITRLFVVVLTGFLVTVLSHPARAQDAVEAAQGARLWSMTCNSCHNARSPLERTDRQWTVIVSHMRTRANLTKSEAEAVKAFLQASNKQRSQEKGKASSRRGEAPDTSAVSRKQKQVESIP
jgi:cytochrome c